MLVLNWCPEFIDSLNIERDDAYARNEGQKERFFLRDLRLRLTLPKLDLHTGNALCRPTNEEKHCRKLPLTRAMNLRIHFRSLAQHQRFCELKCIKMSQSFDVELATSNQEYPNGFASVAAFIAKDPDNTSTIYRRFDRLTARNLLYLQSKLQSLEATQDQLDEEDLRTDDIESKRAATSWEDFERLAKTQGREREKKRMEVAEQIEIAIKKYRQ